MTSTVMSLVEIDGVTCQQSAHELFQLDTSGPEQKVEMIGDECPGKAIGICFLQQICKTFEEKFSISVVAKDIPAFYSTNNNVLKQTRDVESGVARHEIKVKYGKSLFNN